MISLLNGPVYLPPHVRQALSQQICDLRHPRFLEAYAYCRRQVAALLGASEYEVVLAAGSGSFGVELVLRSCLKPADRVLALLMGTFTSRLADIAELAGAQVFREWAAIGDTVPLDRLESLLKKESPHYLLVGHVEPSTATQVHLSAMASLCCQYGASLVVDGVCAGFALDVNCRRDSIGAYVTASQKGLALPPGMAIAVISPELMKRAQVTPKSQTGLYGHLASWTAAKPLFTPPILHIFALEQSLLHITQESMAKRDRRHQNFAAKVHEWARAKGLRRVPVRDDCAAQTLSAFYYPEGLGDAWLYSLRDQKGLELAPSNDPRLAGAYFRIGYLGDLPEDHLTQGLSILNDALDLSRMPALKETCRD